MTFFFFTTASFFFLSFTSTHILFFLLECDIMLNFYLEKIRKEQKRKIIVTYLGVGCFNLFCINCSFTSFISSSCLLFYFLVRKLIFLTDDGLQLIITFSSTRSSLFKKRILVWKQKSDRKYQKVIIISAYMTV